MAKKYVPDIVRKYEKGSKLTMLTAYDFTFASLFDSVGIDILLVGDSLGNVVQGRDTTLGVTTEEMVYHAEQVVRAAKTSMVIADMPFMSFQVNSESALAEAGVLVKKAGVGGVKLEGGVGMESTITKIVDAGIPVMGHVGLLPQSVNQMGFRVQGKEAKSEKRILDDALSVQKAGAFAIVLEGLPAKLAKKITAKLSIPTIGIGAGVDCSGQVLVMHDLLGLKAAGDDFSPKFVKQYVDLGALVKKAVTSYIEEVEKGKFPDKSQSY